MNNGQVRLGCFIGNGNNGSHAMAYSVSLTYLDGEVQNYSFGGEGAFEEAMAFAVAQDVGRNIVAVTMSPVWSPVIARRRVSGTVGS